MLKRVSFFCEFWDFSLSVSKYDRNYRLDWTKMVYQVTNLLAKKRHGTERSDNYQGCEVFASIDPWKATDDAVKVFLTNTLVRLPGFRVTIFERSMISAPLKCKSCSTPIKTCSNCGAPLLRTKEKGVDVALATALLSSAWDDRLDIAVLLTSSADFIPVVEVLRSREIKVAQAGFFPDHGRELAEKCWKQIDLSRHASKIAQSGS